MIEKLNATLYDVLGYLLPGLIVLGALAIAEATFFDGRFLSIETIHQRWVLFMLIAYYLGHAVQSIAANLQSRFHTRLTSTKGRLGMPLYNQAKNMVRERHHFSDEEMKSIHTYEVCLLSDAYTVMSAASGERDVLVSREGFYRGSTVAFLVLCGVLLVAGIHGGAHFYSTPDARWDVDRVETLMLSVGSLLVAILMFDRFKFFNRAKNNFSQLVYLLSKDAVSLKEI